MGQTRGACPIVQRRSGTCCAHDSRPDPEPRSGRDRDPGPHRRCRPGPSRVGGRSSQRLRRHRRARLGRGRRHVHRRGQLRRRLDLRPAGSPMPRPPRTRRRTGPSPRARTRSVSCSRPWAPATSRSWPWSRRPSAATPITSPSRPPCRTRPPKLRPMVRDDRRPVAARDRPRARARPNGGSPLLTLVSGIRSRSQSRSSSAETRSSTSAGDEPLTAEDARPGDAHRSADDQEWREQRDSWRRPVVVGGGRVRRFGRLRRERCSRRARVAFGPGVPERTSPVPLGESTSSARRSGRHRRRR